MTVVGPGAWCDYVTEDEYRYEPARSQFPAYVLEAALADFRSSVSIRVQEFAEQAGGRRLTLHDERGFNVSVVGTGPGSAGLWAS